MRTVRGANARAAAPGTHWLGVSLTSTWFLVALTATALALLATSAALAHWRVVVGGVGVAAGIVAVVAVWFAVVDPLHAGFPQSFFLWGAAPVLALVLAVWTWPRRSWWRRLVGVAAVPVGVAFAAATINAHYAYFPSIAALRGEKAHDQVSHRTVVSIVQAARTSATLPPRGVVLSLDTPTPRSRFHPRGMFVYLPPAWFSVPRPRLPVLMLIAGSPGTPADWTRSAAADLLFDGFASTHRGVAPILVMPDVNGSAFADTECVDGPRGNAETYVVDDVRRFVIDHYGATSDPRSWAVGGLSEGGTCALVLSLRHPGLFGSFLDFGGEIAPTIAGPELADLYGGNRQALVAHLPTHLLDHQAHPGLAAWFEVGLGDRSARVAARRLAPLVVAAGGQACFVERTGGHNFIFWHEALRHSLPWIVSRLGLTAEDTTTACTQAGGHASTSSAR